MSAYPTNPVPGVLLVDLARRLGGAERRVLHLAALLPASGVPVTVVCLAGSPLEKALLAAGVPHVPVSRSRFDPRNAWWLRRLLRRYPDWVVDAHNAQSQLWALLAGAARRPGALVATVHSEYDRSETRLRALSLHERALRLVDRARGRFIAISTSVEDYLHRLDVPADRISTVWSAVQVAEPLVESRQEIRRSLDVAQDAFVVLSAGRLVPVKNHPLLLRALAGLVRDVPAACLLIAGEGPQEAGLRRLVDELRLQQHVRFLGHRDDVPRLLAAADVCAMTSTTEGLPYTLLEAAVAGTPIVSTRVGAIDTVFTDGESAALLDEPDAEEVADALRRLAEEPAAAQAMATTARHLVLDRLSPEAMVEATLAAYAGGPPPPAQTTDHRPPTLDRERI